MNDDVPGISFDISDEVFFGTMIGMLVLAAAGLVTMLAVQLARTWQPRHRMRAVEELSRSANLVVPESLRDPLAHAVAARRRGTVIGSATGLVGVALVIALGTAPWEGRPDSMGVGTWIVSVAIIGGCTTAGAVVGALLGRRDTPATPRAARLTPLTYAELMEPWERRATAACAVVGIVAPAALVVSAYVTGSDDRLDTFVDAGFLLAAGTLAALLWLTLPRIAQRLATARALPGGEHALAWSDALAARTVRDVAYLVMNVSVTTAALCLMGMGLTLPREWERATIGFMTVAMGLALAALMTWLIVSLWRRPERHVQRTLWPQFAADAQ